MPLNIRKRYLALVAATLTSVAFVGAATEMRIAWAHAAPTHLLWNTNEAYLFIGTRRTGWYGNYLEFAWQAIRNALGASTSIKESRPAVIVLRITRSDVQRHTFDGMMPGPVMVRDDEIYILSNGPRRWRDGGFERIDADQERVVHSSPMQEPNFSGVQGWSRRMNLFHGGEGDVPMTLDGETVTVIAETQYSPAVSAGVRLRRAGGDVQALWSVDERARYLSREDYAAFMAQVP